ncbi:ferritin [Hydrogenispora ethanolica]|jgi:ferritin|uniref:Ferritin n=1 Tax=Hydrogenispora ethanolica TaxID=1082276 RepID=A0A4R1S2J1_HYDET|nr:ferritin [Hydrogenispora ethanolica]TCL73239.1 ferritin [Hydrogenispora ethanolica]
MVSTKLLEALNGQIRLEMESSQLYLAMAAYFHDRNLDGMAQWMRAQSSEEYGHAMRIFDHLRDRGSRIRLEGLSQPKGEWTSPLEAFEEAYRHEQFITGKINDLVKLAAAESDYPAGIMLQWFVSEQVEEESSVSKVVQQLKLIGNSGSGLVMLDRQLGKRS